MVPPQQELVVRMQRHLVHKKLCNALLDCLSGGRAYVLKKTLLKNARRRSARSW